MVGGHDRPAHELLACSRATFLACSRHVGEGGSRTLTSDGTVTQSADVLAVAAEDTGHTLSAPSTETHANTNRRSTRPDSSTRKTTAAAPHTTEDSGQQVHCAKSDADVVKAVT